MKWKLVEVVPSVPEDTYRIRTWLGRALQAKSNSNVVSVEPLEKKNREDVCVEFGVWVDLTGFLVENRTPWKWKMHHHESRGQFLPQLGKRGG